jgi:hypothetical protein
VGSRPDVLVSLSAAAPVETALPEANSFLSECQPFDNIRPLHLSAERQPVKDVTDVNDSGL